MSTTANPFEPPRTDLSAAGAPGASDVLPEPALEALVQSAPWSRWAVRLTLISALLTAIHAMVMLGQASRPAEVAGALGAVALTLPMLILWVLLLSRYASHASRLQFREHRALGGVIDAQRSLWKVIGVLFLIFMGLMILMILIMTIAGVVNKR